MKILRPQMNDLLELRHQAQTLGLASQHPVNSVLTGLYQSVFRGQGMDFDEVREYHEGDEIRNMDWRVTARTGTLHLKVYREERQRTVMLCVDIGAHMMFGTRGGFKNIQAARVAALVGWAASVTQDRVGALLYGDPKGLRYFYPGSSRRALWQMLKALTEVENTESLKDKGLLEMMQKLVHGTPTGALIVMVGDFNTNLSRIEIALGKLVQKHEVVLLPIDDPIDHTLPAMGQVTFTLFNGEKLEINTDNNQAREKYHHLWKENRETLQYICNRLGVDIIPLQTDDNVHTALATGLRKRLYRQVGKSG